MPDWPQSWLCTHVVLLTIFKGSLEISLLITTIWSSLVHLATIISSSPAGVTGWEDGTESHLAVSGRFHWQLQAAPGTVAERAGQSDWNSSHKRTPHQVTSVLHWCLCSCIQIYMPASSTKNRSSIFIELALYHLEYRVVYSSFSQVLCFLAVFASLHCFWFSAECGRNQLSTQLAFWGQHRAFEHGLLLLCVCVCVFMCAGGLSGFDTELTNVSGSSQWINDVKWGPW